MAKRIDGFALSEQMFASLIKKLVTEKRKIRSF